MKISEAKKYSDKIVKSFSRFADMEVTGDLRREEEHIAELSFVFKVSYEPDFTDYVKELQRDKILHLCYNGELLKSIFYKMEAGLYAPCKLYRGTEDNYGFIKLFTTGDHRFVKYVVRKLGEMGYYVNELDTNHYPLKLRTEIRTKFENSLISVPTEEDVFRHARLDFIEPNQRSKWTLK